MRRDILLNLSGLLISFEVFDYFGEFYSEISFTHKALTFLRELLLCIYCIYSVHILTITV